MRAFCAAVAVAILLGVAGCGSETNSAMPDVTGKKLDMAETAIKKAGFSEEVKVEGGGMLGIVDKSNWEVCEQQPAVGKPISDSPQLTVDRTCQDAKASATSKPSETPPATSEPEAAASIEPDADQVLTKANNKEFAALLAVSDPCDEAIAPFAAKYAGRTIAFNGSIADMANHGDYKTRYDFLISPGNEGTQSTVGPNFKFDVENVLDLKLTGDEIPSYVGEGDRFRFIAEVGEFNQDQCLLFLEPVATKVR